MSKTSPPASLPLTELPYNPAMPYALPLPFPGAWAGMAVVYDLYRVEKYLDDEPVYMAELNEVKRQLDARALVLNAPPPDLTPDAATQRAADLRQWSTDLHAWQRADACRQIAYYVQGVTWEYAAAPPDPQVPATWDAWLLPMLQWVTGEGWNAARAVLYDPKLRIGSTPSLAGPTS